MARQRYAEEDVLKAQEFVNTALDLGIAAGAERAQLEQLANATQNYLNAKDENAQAVAMNTILKTYVSHSDALFAAQDFCGAYAEIQSTLALVPQAEAYRYQGRLSDYQSRCLGLEQESPLIVNSDGSDGLDSNGSSGMIEAAEIPPLAVDTGVVMSPDIPENISGNSPGSELLDGLSGRILYTTQTQGIRNAMAVGLRSRTDTPMTASLQAIVLDYHVLRFSQFIQDDTMRHTNWNPSGSQISYTSYREGVQPQIYLAQAQNLQESVALIAGQEAAWNPRGDLLAYSGLADDGGIWQIHVETKQRNRLTENAGDRHPVWTPDGKAIVFMSSSRDNNWELYIYNRLAAAGQEVTRLTNHSAQDSLPAISPDGKHLAFLSDRGGKWQVWVMSLEAGKIGNNEAELLFDTAGQMADWSQETIQWVP